MEPIIENILSEESRSTFELLQKKERIEFLAHLINSGLIIFPATDVFQEMLKDFYDNKKWGYAFEQVVWAKSIPKIGQDSMMEMGFDGDV